MICWNLSLFSKPVRSAFVRAVENNDEKEKEERGERRKVKGKRWFFRSASAVIMRGEALRRNRYG